MHTGAADDTLVVTTRVCAIAKERDGGENYFEWENRLVPD